MSSTRCEAGEVAWLVGAFKQQLVEREPTLCVTTAATPAAAVQALGQRGGATAGEGAALEGVVPVKVLPRSEFRADLARMLLASVVVPDWQQQRPATASAPASASASASAAAAAAGPAALPASFDLAFARLSSIVNTDDAALVRAAGGLLHFLRQGGRLIEAELDDGALGGLAEAPDMMAAAGDEYGGGGGTPAAALRPITLRGGLHVFSLGAHMQVDAVTYSALNILPPLGASAGAAGGLSLQALLDRTRSAPGRRLLRTWLQQPSLDLDALRHRHDAVELLVAAAAQAPDLIAALRTHLRGAKDIARMLLRIKKVAASPADWLGVLRSVQAALAIKSVVAQLLRAVRLRKGGAAAAAAAAAEPAAAGAAASAPDSAQSPLLLKQLVAEVSDEQLAYVQSALDMIIDWAASQEARRLRVRSGVDATLDEHRRVYEQLPDFLSGVAVQQLQNFPQLRSLAIKYLPQIGCVFCIDKADHELLGAPAAAAAAGTQFARVAGSERVRAFVPADFVLQFETAEALHYKTPYTAELDRDIGDVAAVAADIEAAICRQLEDRLLEQELLLLTVGARLAEVDVLAAFAEVAAERRYCRPQLVDDAVVFARQARHPLQELTVETFVPNDSALAPAGRHAGIAAVAVVTGPNFSGKSVYLKTVGLLAFMAQVGSFVPAQEARVGLVDRLFSRIHSLETLSLGLSSSFAIDLNQVGLMMKHATPRSLLLVDGARAPRSRTAAAAPSRRRAAKE